MSAAYDKRDPIHALQRSIETGWTVTSIPNVFYAGGYSDAASSESSPEHHDEYCIMEFGDAERSIRTNDSAIWNVPVTVKVYDVSMDALRPKVTALRSYLNGGEVDLADSGLTIVDGNLVGVQCSRVRYSMLEPSKATAEFELSYKLALPVG